MRISLEELKARSKSAVYYPDTIRIAREAKSPTAAFELANKTGINAGYAKECRFLAMIKRDYGKKVFEQAVNDIEKEVLREMNCAYLKPFIQTANRLSYLFQKHQGFSFSNMYIPSDYDSDYADVVEGALEHFEKMDHHQRLTMINAIGSGNTNATTAYLNEAKGFADHVSKRMAVDSYCLEKTVSVLCAYIFTVGSKSEILNLIGGVSDRVHWYSACRKHAKEKTGV